MGIGTLNHVNLRTTRLDQMIDWYQRALELKVGPRPDFPFPGAWLYAGDTAHVHLVGVEAEAVGSEASLKLEHFAFSATGRAAFEDRFQRLDIPFRRMDLAAVGIIQLNVWDPDGNHIHIDFAADE